MNTADRQRLISSIVASPTYRLAQEDHEFLDSDAARGARLELEMMRPERYLQALNIASTIVVFGSARLLPPDEAQRRLDLLKASATDARQIALATQRLKYARYYDEARAFAQRISAQCQTNGQRDLVIVTGGGPGAMEAANRGA